MDFKFNELKDVLLDKKGFLPIAISFGLQMVMSMLLIIPMLLLMGIFAFSYGEFSEVGSVMLGIIVLFSLLIFFPLGILIQAGLYGSLQQVIEGKDFVWKDYMYNMKKYFLPVLGYGIVYTILIMIIAVPIGIMAAIPSLLLPQIGFLVDIFVGFLIMIITMLLIPIAYMAVVKGNKMDKLKKLYKNKWKELLVISVIAGFFMIIPFVSILFSFVLVFLPAYILVLFNEGEEDIIEVIEDTSNTEE